MAAPGGARVPARVLAAGAAVGVVAMTAVIGRALVVGDAGAELKQLLEMPWGVVSLVDLYTGFSRACARPSPPPPPPRPHSNAGACSALLLATVCTRR